MPRETKTEEKQDERVKNGAGKRLLRFLFISLYFFYLPVYLGFISDIDSPFYETYLPTGNQV